MRKGLNNLLDKLLKFAASPNRFERAVSLIEIRLNFLLYGEPCDGNVVSSFDDFVSAYSPSLEGLRFFLSSNKETEMDVSSAFENFKFAAAPNATLPFPAFFNADISLAMLTYSLVRHLKPNTVIETGVGYGITSSIILKGLERNGLGRLISIDLPSISDPEGEYVGLAVPAELRKRWTLLRGTSRRLLPKVLSQIEGVDLLVSDSANVFTLQRFELECARTKLSPIGAALFNNIGQRFEKCLKSFSEFETYNIRQIEKTSCVTALLLKKK